MGKTAGFNIGDKTAKRILIYFLADLRVLTPELAAEILVQNRLKSQTIRVIVDQIKYLLK